jgi:hypothetical protein
MAVRITERELVVPTLQIATDRLSGEISTSDLIIALTELFEPEGEDAEILPGRNDTRFSQKVRNLVSHREGRNTMFARGYAEYMDDGIKVTGEGRRFVRSLPSHE